MTKPKRKRRERHGASGTPLHMRYCAMIARCHNINHADYRFWGARGVKVCKRWRDSFAAYAADVGEPPFPGAHLSRIDPTGNYEPGNVRWSSRTENLKASRSVRRIKTHAGEMTLPEAAAMVGKSQDAVSQRVRKGMAPAKALIIDKGVQKQIAAKYTQAPELTLQTVRTIASEADVPYQGLRLRLAAGMTVADAIADIRGSTYGKITKAARRLGIRANTISVRMARGMSFEEATTRGTNRRTA